MRRTVVVVRTGGVPDDLSEALAGAGFSVHHEPVLAVEPTGMPPELNGDRALIFTSANGVTAYAARSGQRKAPVFTVGAQTARAALDSGFSDVYDAGGTVQDLAVLLSGQAQEKYLYVRGEDVSTDLASLPELARFSILEWVGYHTPAAQNLTPALADAFGADDIAAMMFFSKKGAEAFVSLIGQSGISPHFENIKALCIGEGMVKSVSVLPFSSVHAAKRPDRSGMMDLIHLIDNPSDATQEQR